MEECTDWIRACLRTVILLLVLVLVRVQDLEEQKRTCLRYSYGNPYKSPTSTRTSCSYGPEVHGLLDSRNTVSGPGSTQIEARNSRSTALRVQCFWNPEVRWTSVGSPWTSVLSPKDFRKSKSPRNTPGIRPHARRNATGLFDSCPHRTFPVLQIYARGVSSSGCLPGETAKAKVRNRNRSRSRDSSRSYPAKVPTRLTKR